MSNSDSSKDTNNPTQLSLGTGAMGAPSSSAAAEEALMSQQQQHLNHHHYKARYKKQLQQHKPPNHLLARMLRGIRFSIRSGLLTLNQQKVPGLKVVPTSVLDEIKIHGPLNDAQLDKARQRQSLFLNKRRVSKQRKQFFTRIKVLIRLTLCLAIITGWWLLWGQSFWMVSPNNISIQHFNSAHQDQSFVDDQAVKAVILPFLKKPLYWQNPHTISTAIKTTVKPTQPIDQVIVRRRLFPASLDITIIEKPIWATRIPLTNALSSSLGQAQQALLQTLAPAAVASPSKPPQHLPIETLVLRHPNGDKTSLRSQQLTNTQREFIKTHPVIYTRQQTLTIIQWSLLEKAITQLELYAPLFNQYQEQLLSIDARDPHNVMAYFTHFKVRFGRINSQLPKRVARLPKTIPTLTPYLSKLDWVELGWNNQLTLKLKTAQQVDALTPQP